MATIEITKVEVTAILAQDGKLNLGIRGLGDRGVSGGKIDDGVGDD